MHLHIRKNLDNKIAYSWHKKNDNVHLTRIIIKHMKKKHSCDFGYRDNRGLKIFRRISRGWWKLRKRTPKRGRQNIKNIPNVIQRILIIKECDARSEQSLDLSRYRKFRIFPNSFRFWEILDDIDWISWNFPRYKTGNRFDSLVRDVFLEI